MVRYAFYHPDILRLFQPVFHQLQRTVHHLAQRDRLSFVPRLPDEQQQVLDYLAAAHRAFIDGGQVLGRDLAGSSRAAPIKDLGVARYRAKRVVKLVRHPRDKLPHRGKLFRLYQLGLSLALLGSVPDDHGPFHFFILGFAGARPGHVQLQFCSRRIHARDAAVRKKPLLPYLAQDAFKRQRVEEP